MDKLRLYYQLPVSFQNLSVSLKGWDIQRKRYSPQFSDLLRTAEERAHWSSDQVIKYRDDRLSDYIKYVYDHVPYYQRLFSDLNLRPEEIQSLQDLEKLPLLNKEAVKENFSTMISEVIPAKQQVMDHTSGTTGSGFHFLTTRMAQREQWAIWWRYRRYHGIRRGTLCGYFGGQSIVPPSRKGPPFWRYDVPGKRILFSAYHMSRENIGAYIEELRRKQPPWLHGYPSLITLLASYIIESGESPDYQIDWITTGAENLLEQQKQIIYQAFDVVPVEHYGLSEAVANFSECKNGNFHVDEDFSAVEFIADPQSSGYKVIGTNYSNLAFPLIRYETGDIVQLGLEECDCGLPGRIVSQVDGRKEDYIILNDGSKIGRLDHIFKDITNIKEAQIVQKEMGVILVRIVPTDAYAGGDRNLLQNEFKARVGDRLEIIIEELDELERSSTGKLRFVISEVNQGKLEKTES